MSGCGGGCGPGLLPPALCYDLDLGVQIPDRAMYFPQQPVPVQVGDIAKFGQYVGPTLRVPLPVVQGNSLEITFRAFRTVNMCWGKMSGSGPQTLTGFEGASTARKAKGFPLFTELEVIVDQTGAGSPTQGLVTVRATPEVTTLFPQFGVFDLELYTGLGDTLRKTIVEGPITYNRSVTLAVV